LSADNYVFPYILILTRLAQILALHHVLESSVKILATIHMTCIFFVFMSDAGSDYESLSKTVDKASVIKIKV
jgi:hypothetical protein